MARALCIGVIRVLLRYYIAVPIRSRSTQRTSLSRHIPRGDSGGPQERSEAVPFAMTINSRPAFEKIVATAAAAITLV